jgi:hypothetical protein
LAPRGFRYSPTTRPPNSQPSSTGSLDNPCKNLEDRRNSELG